MPKKSSNKSNNAHKPQIKKTRYLVFLITSGFLFLCDQILKLFVRTNPDTSWMLIDGLIGFEPFNNPGVAFGIPVPNIFLVAFSPVLILVLGYYLLKEKKSAWHIFGTVLLLSGAVSNYIDRLLFEVTIDYIRLYTSIINIADVMITVGAICILLSEYFYKKHNQGGICSQQSIPPLLSD